MSISAEIHQQKRDRQKLAFSGMQVKLQYKGKHNGQDFFILLLNDLKKTWIKHPFTMSMYADEACRTAVYWQDYYDMCSNYYMS